MRPGQLVRIELRVGEITGTRRGYRHLFVAGPASGREIAVSVVCPAPHQQAARLFLWDARHMLRSLVWTGRQDATTVVPDLWSFVATLELPDD